MDRFETYFGCTYEQYQANRKAELIAALRGDRRAARGSDRAKAGKDLLDLVRKNPYLCEAILFELERQDAERSDWGHAWILRASKRRAVSAGGE